jgi:hypothetical protein
VFEDRLSAFEFASLFALVAKNFLLDMISGLSGKQRSRGSKSLPLGDSLYLASIWELGESVDPGGISYLFFLVMLAIFIPWL